MSDQTIRASGRLKLSSRVVTHRVNGAVKSRWRVPQLRVSNVQLLQAGFEAGDYVLVTIPRRGVLVILKDPDQHESAATKLRRRRIARAGSLPPGARRPGDTRA